VTLRILALFAIALGAAVLIDYLTELGKGPWSDPSARHLRAMKDRTGSPAGLEPFTIAAMAGLPRRAPLREVAPIERRGVVVEGYVQRMERAADGDYHLDFAPETRGPDGPLVPFVSAEITPQWHRDSGTWRYERLVDVLRPIYGGVTTWDRGPRRVRLGGWLTYDFEYEGSRPVAPFPPHLSFWEIHPVTRIEVWDEARAAYVEVPR